MKYLTALISELEETVHAFVAHFQQDKKFDGQIYAEWTEKDVLGHIVFWHESFARNVQALTRGHEPNVLKGKLSEVNLRSVESTRPHSIPSLLARLQEAQHVISTHVQHPDLALIPYKKGSRSYPPDEHLAVVNRHIQRHLKDLISFAQKQS